MLARCRGNEARFIRLPGDGCDGRWRRWIKGERDRLVRRYRGQISGDLFRRGQCLNITRAGVLAGTQFVELAKELELLIYAAQRGRVRRLNRELVERELDRDVAFDGREPLTHFDALAIILEALAVRLALDL